MGEFELVIFLFFALIPGICTLSVLVLMFTRWRSSRIQLMLCLVCLGYGITYALLLRMIAGASLMLVIYGLPTLVGGAGLFVLVRSRALRKNKSQH